MRGALIKSLALADMRQLLAYKSIEVWAEKLNLDINSSQMPEQTTLLTMSSGVLSHPATCLVDSLRVNGANKDARQRKISLDKIYTKKGKRRQSLPVLPSYLVLKEVKKTVQKRRKGVTFSLGVLMQQAVANGDIAEMQKLITSHGREAVEEREPNGLPPLMRAIFEGQNECLKVILENGADVLAQDPEKWNALHVAAAMDDITAAELILEACHNPLAMTESLNLDEERPIDLADNLEMARLLLNTELTEHRQQSSRLAEETVCTRDAEPSSQKEVLQLVNDHYGKHSDCTALDEVLETNTSYNSLLHLAAAKNYVHLADYVCKNKLSSLEKRDKNGWTPLHTAAYYNSLDVAMLLVEEGADTNALTHSYEKPLDLTEHQVIVPLLEGDPHVNSL